MKIKIIKSEKPSYWYAGKIGQIFEVEECNIYNYRIVESDYYISKSDCEILKENELNPNYDGLYKVLMLALKQASEGKGSERHANGEAFEKQKICEISRRLGSNDYNLGQAVKKIYESKRLPKERAIAELLGAINYIAAGIIILEESED